MIKKLMLVLIALVAFQSNEQAVVFASNPSETHPASCTIIIRGFRPMVPAFTTIPASVRLP